LTGAFFDELRPAQEDVALHSTLIGTLNAAAQGIQWTIMKDANGTLATHVP